MFHYFKIPYFTCTLFTKFTYNEYIRPYFLSHVVLQFSPVNSLRDDVANNELIEEADNVQVGDVVVDRLGSKDVESALVTLKRVFETKPIDVTPLI
jgi:hypothetical protein